MRNIKNLTLSAVFLSLGVVLPFLTGQIKEIGDTLLPMHLPVMLCGLICGSKYGLVIGLILPFLRALIAGMPPIYPNAVWMALELATYGFVIGALYCFFKRKNIATLYFSLIVSMLCGRAVWGISKAVLLGIAGKAFGFEAFMTGAFVDSLLGIVLQLLLIPFIIKITKQGE